MTDLRDLAVSLSADEPDDADDLLRRHRESLFPSVGLFYDEPIELRRGERQYVYDGEGNQYLDFFGGIATVPAGHPIREINEPIKEQLDRIIHSSTLFLIRSQIELAERLRMMTPPRLNKVFFTNSGTEANEAAFLITTLNRQSNELIALRHSYHGRSFATINASGQTPWRSSTLSPLQVHYVGNPYCYRCPWEKTYPSCDLLCARDVEAIIQGNTSGRPAAFIAEPIQGVGGFAKGLANGIPIGGLIATDELAGSIRSLSLSTFGGNPIATTAALANLNYFLTNNLRENARDVGAYLKERLWDLMDKHPSVGDVRGMGLMVGVELVRDRATKEPAPDLLARVLEGAKQRGLIVGRGGLHANTLRLCPPLIVTKGDVDVAVGILDAAVEDAVAAG